MPLGRGLRPFLAWYGDMDLLPHLWEVVALGRITVVVEFHAPTSLAEAGSRKALAGPSHDRVAAGAARANSARPSETPPELPAPPPLRAADPASRACRLTPHARGVGPTPATGAPRVPRFI